MRILITGSSGPLGSTIAQQLSSEHMTRGIDIISGQQTQHVVSIRDRNAMFQLAEGMDAIIHIASLHHPHLATHSEQDFIETNITGTRNLLEAGVQAGIKRFIYTSTTSLYGFAMVPHDRAVWVTEDLQPRPRDIYDRTKIAAEKLCYQFASEMGISVICLRVSRFFDQTPELLAIYRLYRGVDVQDVATAHILAITNQDIICDTFNISAHSPFSESDTYQLWHDAPTVLRRTIPTIDLLFAQHGWQLPQRIDRVYVTAKAEQILRYRPRYNFAEYIASIAPEET